LLVFWKITEIYEAVNTYRPNTYVTYTIICRIFGLFPLTYPSAWVELKQ